MKKDDQENLTDSQREIANMIKDIFSFVTKNVSLPTEDVYRGAGKTKSREQMISEMDEALDKGDKDRYLFLCKQFNILYRNKE
jgi:uncharacterized protein YpiB (UPF0302 family)